MAITITISSFWLLNDEWSEGVRAVQEGVSEGESGGEGVGGHALMFSNSNILSVHACARDVMGACIEKSYVPLYRHAQYQPCALVGGQLVTPCRRARIVFEFRETCAAAARLDPFNPLLML